MAGVSKNGDSLALGGDPQIPAAARERIRREARRLGYGRDPEVSELMARLSRGHSAGHETQALMNAHEDASALRIHPKICVHSQVLRKGPQTHLMPTGRAVLWIEGGLFRACPLGSITSLIATSLGLPAGP